MTKIPRVLFVDDNANLLNAIKRVLRKQVELVTAESGEEALKLLETGPEFAVLISDQNMPNMKGSVLLSEVAKRWPMTVRVMLTGNDDQATAMDAVNDGQVFRFLRKPSDPEAILEVIKSANSYYNSVLAEKQLLEKTLAGSIKVLSDLLAALRPDLFQRAVKVRKCAKAVALRLELQRAWELDLAAMFYPLGMAALSEQITVKYSQGKALSAEERVLIDQSTEMASNLIRNIPRLEKVAQAVSMCRKGYDGSGFPKDDVKGSQIPELSRILRIIIDLIDVTASNEVELEAIGNPLKKQAHLYDPSLLNVVTDIVVSSLAQSDTQTASKMDVTIGELLEGDVVLVAIHDDNEKLILAAGAELTEVTIHRLVNWAKNVGISSKITISRNVPTI